MYKLRFPTEIVKIRQNCLSETYFSRSDLNNRH